MFPMSSATLSVAINCVQELTYCSRSFKDVILRRYFHHVPYKSLVGFGATSGVSVNTGTREQQNIKNAKDIATNKYVRTCFGHFP